MTSAANVSTTTEFQSIFDIKDAWKLEDNVEETGPDGYGLEPYYAWYGVGVIVFAVVGIAGNVTAFVVLTHKGLRGTFAVYTCSLLIADVAFLLCENLGQVPGAWLNTIRVQDHDAFMAQLTVAQSLFVQTHAVRALSQTLITWLTFVLVGEQWAVIYRPHLVLKVSNSIDHAIKITITVFNGVVLVHLAHFFKLVIKPIGVDDHARICLSNIYVYSIYRWYDLIGHFLFFVLTAWVLLLAMVIAIAVGIRTKRYDIGDVLGDQRLFRVFKSGRSIRTSMVIGIWYLIWMSLAHISHLVSWHYGTYGSQAPDCHFRPTSRLFLHTPAEYELLAHVTAVINSAFRFPLLVAANSKFRRILFKCFRRQKEAVRTIGSVVGPRPSTSTSSQLDSVSSSAGGGDGSNLLRPRGRRGYQPRGQIVSSARTEGYNPDHTRRLSSGADSVFFGEPASNYTQDGIFIPTYRTLPIERPYLAHQAYVSNGFPPQGDTPLTRYKGRGVERNNSFLGAMNKGYQPEDTTEDPKIDSGTTGRTLQIDDRVQLEVPVMNGSIDKRRSADWKRNADRQSAKEPWV